MDYSPETSVDEFIKSNLKNSPFNKKKFKNLFESYVTNIDLIKNTCKESESEKYNKVSTYLLYSFFSEFLLSPELKKVLINEYIEISKDFLTKQEVNFFNHLIDKIVKKYLENKIKIE